jgi:hypothetical protein
MNSEWLVAKHKATSNSHAAPEPMSQSMALSLIYVS